MAQLAIQGHPTRGNEVIALLEMLGGKNIYKLMGTREIWYVLSGSTIEHSAYIFGEKGFTLEEFLEQFPYKVGDKVSSKYLKNYEISKMGWESTNNRVIYKLQGMGWYAVNELQPYKEETMERKYNVEEYLKVWEETEKGLEIVVNDNFELKEDSGKFYIIKKQPQYPKTYKECCDMLGVFNTIHVKKLTLFKQLINTRNAYWKIAGEQMGLDEPWEPDYNEESYEQGSPKKYVIYYTGTYITKGVKCTPSHILAFPTEEMRDAFYENFKELIETCKELL